LSKIQYKYNPETLTYDKVQLSFGQKLKKALPWIFGSLVFAATVVAISFAFFKSPREQSLIREYNQLTSQYETMRNEMKQVEAVLDDIRRKDDNLYRVILESEPYPIHKRQLSSGGSSRYSELEGYNSSQLLVSTRQLLDRVQKKLYAQSQSYEEVIKLAKKKEKLLRSIPAIIPVATNLITAGIGGFGYRIDPIYRNRSFHAGMDFPCKTGTPIRATGDAEVAGAESNYWGYGNAVILNHGSGYQTLYAHLSAFNVKPGQKIKRGDIIGFAGSTGKSTAPHLHYEVIKNGEKVNPVNYYYNDLTPAQYEEMLKASAEASTSFD
jgi:murein DD-endopeptidase MepM/ murein hydrolase activator NlpD